MGSAFENGSVVSIAVDRLRFNFDGDMEGEGGALFRLRFEVRAFVGGVGQGVENLEASPSDLYAFILVCDWWRFICRNINILTPSLVDICVLTSSLPNLESSSPITSKFRHSSLADSLALCPISLQFFCGVRPED